MPSYWPNARDASLSHQDVLPREKLVEQKRAVVGMLSRGHALLNELAGHPAGHRYIISHIIKLQDNARSWACSHADRLSSMSWRYTPTGTAMRLYHIKYHHITTQRAVVGMLSRGHALLNELAVHPAGHRHIIKA
jgi:hypothetical protein